MLTQKTILEYKSNSYVCHSIMSSPSTHPANAGVHLEEVQAANPNPTARALVARFVLPDPVERVYSNLPGPVTGVPVSTDQSRRDRVPRAILFL